MNDNYKPPKKVRVSGATAPDGTPYVCVKDARRRAWLPRSAFTSTGVQALGLLIDAGIPLLGDEWVQCRQKVAELREFPAKPLISSSGWNGQHFALPDGSVISPNGSGDGSKPVVLFHADKSKCATVGTLAGWRRATAIVAEQPIATFVLCTSFAGPLLALTDRAMNQGFEIAGPKGVGKSTLQRLAAAACGPANDPQGRNYWITANATVNGLEQVLAEHESLSMIIEETNLFAAGKDDKSRAAAFNELVFRLADGTAKRRHGDKGLQQRHRFVYLTSTNEPLATLLMGSRVDVSEAAADRLITIAIDGDRPFKIFDSLPAKWSSSSAMASDLNAAIAKHHGHGIRKFLDTLVRTRASRPQWVGAELKAALDRFRDAVSVDRNDGSAVRVADAFGLVAVAGEIAVRCGAVSPKLKPFEAALACYDLCRAAESDNVRVLERLLRLRDHPKVIHVDCARLRKITDEEIGAAPAIVRVGRSGRVELLLTDKQLDRAFPSRSQLFADADVAKLHISEADRRQTKRKIRKGYGKERFYCFRIDVG